MIIYKNEATASKRRIGFAFFDNSGDPLAGQTFAGGSSELQLSKDGAAWVNAAGSATAVGSGFYYYEASQAEVNYDTLRLKISKSTYTDVFVEIDLIDPSQTIAADVTKWLGVAVSALGSSGGIPLVGDQVPDADAGDVGGLPVITAVGQGPGGTLKPNCRIDNYVYDGGNRPTSWRVRVFADKTACDASVAGHADDADGEVERETYTATYDGSGLLTSLKRDKDL